MENPVEKATTSLIVNKDELDALLIAMSDSSKKAESVISIAEDANQFSKYVDKLSKAHKIELDKAEELFEQAVDLAEFLLSTFPGIISQIKEVLPEVEDEDKLRQTPLIIQP